jgi:hypothetical protein
VAAAGAPGAGRAHKVSRTEIELVRIVMAEKSVLYFWKQNNLWRMIAFPVLFIVVLMVWRNLFWDRYEIPAPVLEKFAGGGQCMLLVDFPGRAWVQIYFVSMFLVAIVEITAPSLIHNVKPKYSDPQRIWYAVLHSFAWAALAFGISKLFIMIACGT